MNEAQLASQRENGDEVLYLCINNSAKWTDLETTGPSYVQSSICVDVLHGIKLTMPESRVRNNSCQNLTGQSPEFLPRIMVTKSKALAFSL